MPTGVDDPGARGQQMKRLPRTALSSALVSAAALAGMPMTATAGPAGLPLPDLLSEAPDNQRAVEVDPDDALVLRFNGYLSNAGPGPLHVEGDPAALAGSGLEPRQYVFEPDDYRDGGVGAPPIDPASLSENPNERTGWAAVATPPVTYDSVTGSFNFQLQGALRYSLWSSRRTAQVAPSQDVGVCLWDVEGAFGDLPGLAPLFFGIDEPFGYVEQYNGGGDNCAENDPEATRVLMGISPGWRDTYPSILSTQRVDVSDTAPGEYYLAAEADPENRLVEANEVNGVAFADDPTTIPGYNAQAISSATAFQSPVGLTMRSEQFGSPGARVFRVVTPPANGTLSVPTGVTLTSPSLRYRPSPGFSGVDGFEYVVQDSTSPYPRNPRTAAAAIRVGAAAAVGVAPISGAPAKLIVGTSAQLSSSVVNGSRGVTWSVGGVPGGNASVGTITAGGLYRAPATVPRGGVVTIRATSVDDPGKFAQRSITIVRAPTVTARRGATKKFSEPRVAVYRGRAELRTRAKVTGRFTVAARELRPGRRARVLDLCKGTRAAGRTFRCTLRFSKRLNRKHIQIIVVFKPRSGRKVVRRVGPTKFGAIRFSVAKRGALKGRRVTVRARTLRTGRVVMVLRHRKKVVRRCVVNRLAGQVATCQVTLKPGQSVKNLRAVATLRAEDGLRVTRRGRP